MLAVSPPTTVKPLTRTQFDQLVPDRRKAQLLATIEQGFAPDPPTEREVWEWLHGEPCDSGTGHEMWMAPDDFQFAVGRAEAFGILGHLEPISSHVWSVRVRDEVYRYPWQAARALAALAFAEFNTWADVSHLLVPS